MKKRQPLMIILLCVWSLVTLGCTHLNTFQREGDLRMTILKAPVDVLRDEKGMAYIYAASEDDLIRAQGFVTAQDRLFQMEMTRLFVSGRISELTGKAGLGSDIRSRTIGFVRQAKRHAAILNAETRRHLQLYADGVNAFIARFEDLPLEFSLSGIRPEPWTITDTLAIGYYMGWNSAANLKDEVIAQLLVEKLGPTKARELFPVNINPDEENACPPAKRGTSAATWKMTALDFAADERLMSLWTDESPGFRIGSNNWVTGPDLSAGGKPIVASDPHLDARVLPGPWYPCGLITPSHRAVGVAIPGVPGMSIGRTDHIAFGMTNAYSDGQDLFIETIDPADPARYLEGKESLPFDVLRETIRIKDPDAGDGFREEEIVIRLTKRGPVVSGVMRGLDGANVVTLRWSPFETMGPSLGLENLPKARNVDDVRESLRHVTMIMLNFVFADTAGRYGWQTTGRLPIRTRGDGFVPFRVSDGLDDWSGWIPFEEMPHAYDPPRGWLGTCNHHTVPCDYPHYYTSHAAPSYRYRRLGELLAAPGKKTAEDHWRFQWDDVNLMARRIAPLMAKALTAQRDTEALGRILDRWNYRDDVNQAAPAVFQAVYRQFFFAVYQDELGVPLTRVLINNPYFWQESLQKAVLAGESPWFDDTSTPAVRETRDDLFRRAAREVYRELSALYGTDPETWTWGRLHRLNLVSPIRRAGLGSDLLGGGSHAMGGSGETLYRAAYNYERPYNVTESASLRMVADLGDPDKVLAVLPGGTSGRLFDPHYGDQIAPFMNGEVRYWWFSDEKIREHAQEKMRLVPFGAGRR